MRRARIVYKGFMFHNRIAEVTRGPYAWNWRGLLVPKMYDLRIGENQFSLPERNDTCHLVFLQEEEDDSTSEDGNRDSAVLDA